MGLTRSDAADLLQRLSRQSVVVVGDLFLDEYLVGRAERLSREGPVPVLAFKRRFTVPGGAANPARNIAALGARAAQVGVVGDDEAGVELTDLLRRAGIDVAGVVTDPHRATIVKTRIVAEGLSAPQQIARIDRQERGPVAGLVEAELVEAIRRAAQRSGAILVSDYKSGVVTDVVREACRTGAAASRTWLTVDSQGDLERFEGFHLVRAARRDAEASLGVALADEAAIEGAATDLRRALGARIVVISRGSEGMSVAHEDGYAVVHPSNVSEVFDVAGAGDTVIALLTLAVAAGAGVDEAVHLANRAAGLVVRRLGVAAPTADEILAAFDPA